MVQQQTTFDETFDAIIGLAYPAMAEDAGLPLFDEMMDQNLLVENKFSFYHSQNADEDGELLFGGVN